MTETTTLYSYHAMVIHPHRSAVLLVRDEQTAAWSLPGWTTEERPKVESAEVVRMLRELLRLETLALLCYDFERTWTQDGEQPSYIKKVYAMECRTLQEIPVSGLWCTAEQLPAIPLAQEEHRRVIQAWLTELTSDYRPLFRAPWAQPGWLHSISPWIEAELRRYGLKVEEDPQQLHATCLSTVYRIPTSGKTAFFKATSTHAHLEPAFLSMLARLSPGTVPTILAMDEEKGWLLMEDFGGCLLNGVSDLAVWKEAIARYAQLQLSCVSSVDVFLAAGVRDRRLDQLADQVEKLLLDNRWLKADIFINLSEEDVRRAPELLERIKQDCLHLAAHALPETIDHGDFHPLNIAVTDHGPLFFDWSDLMITHPFFSMVSIFAFVEHFQPSLENGQELDWMDQLRDTYLQQWVAFEPLDRLKEAFLLARRLGLVVLALNFQALMEQVEPRVQLQLEPGMTWWYQGILSLYGDLQ